MSVLPPRGPRFALGWPGGKTSRAPRCERPEQKKALYQRITALLGDKPGVRPEDVFINLVEVVKENWSFGHGLAQYALRRRCA